MPYGGKMTDKKKFAENYLAELKKTIDGVKAEDVGQVINILLEAYNSGRTVFIMGNGGSSSTASHFVSDLAKGTAVGGRKRFRAVCLSDNIPLLTAWSNDTDYSESFKEQLANFVEDGDIVIALSGSGNSGNVLKAVEYANEKGATTIGFTGFDGGKLAKLCKKSIVVQSDNMERIEDMHLILEHIIKLCIREIIQGR